MGDLSFLFSLEGNSSLSAAVLRMGLNGGGETFSFHSAPFPVLQGFSVSAYWLILAYVDTLGWVILCHGGCPENSRMLSSISGLYPLDASSIPPTPSCDS